MKKFLVSCTIACSLFLIACGGKSEKKDGDKKDDAAKEEVKQEPVKETAASIAQQWCELNGKVARATSDAEKEAAKKVQKEFEDAMEKKYENDKAFMDEIGKEVEKCEDASEGR